MSIVVNKTRLPVTQWQTESGSVVSISDARKRYAKSLSVALEPIQDLHGYASPWVGGGGANLFDIEKATIGSGAYGLSISRSGDTIRIYGTCSASGTATRFFAILSYADYSLSGKSYVVQALDVVGGTFTSVYGLRTATEKSVAVGMKLTENQQYDVTFKISVSATSQTAWSPYENLCPISGRSSVTAYDDPKYGGKIWWNQLLKIEPSDQSAERNGLVFTDNRNGSYTLNGTMESGSNFGRFPISLTKDHVYIISPGSPNVCLTSTMGYSTTFGERLQTATSTAIAIHSFYCPNGRTFNNITTYPNVFDLTEMFGAGNEPDTVEAFRALFPKDYYEYNAGTETLVSAVNGDPCWNVSVSLGQTVYGGSVDLVSGVMTVTNVYKAFAVNDMNNSENYPGWSGFGMRDIFGAGKQFKTSYLCDSFIGKTVGINTEKNNDIVYVVRTQWDVASQTEFKQVYGGYVFGFVFPLDTPQTIQLSPNQIEMLMRNNTVWSDAGVVTLNYARIRQ